MNKLLQNILLFNNFRIPKTIIFIVGTVLILISAKQSFGQSKLERSINAISADTEIDLSDNWEFYWNQLIKPGDFKANQSFSKVSLNSWTTYYGKDSNLLPPFGYGTYRLVISIPENRPHMSIFIPKAFASSKLWINGEFISEIGKVATNKKETIHRRFSQIIPLDDHDSEFEIVIQVANFYHSKAGFNEPLKLASSQRLNNVNSKRIIADMLFIGCLGFIGGFFLLFFMFYWNKDKAILYFSLMCLGLCYMALSDRYAPLAEISESVSWVLLTKIEYIALFLAGTSAGLFINTIFYEFAHKAYNKTLKYGFALLVAMLLLLPSPYFTHLLFPFLILMIVNLSYVFFVIIKAIIVGKRQESILLLVSTILGSIVFTFHILAFLGKDANSIIYVNFGYVLAFLLLSMLLMNRFSKSFKELETTKEIALQQKNEISMQSRALTDVNVELKENLKQLENYNSELDGFNRIVSHDLKAPLVAMHSLVSFIEEDTKTIINKETEQHFELLKERILKMDTLIKGLLEYSKVARGDKTKNWLNFNHLLTEVFETVNLNDENTLNLPQSDIQVYVNKIELKHVFQNLISNAITHNDKDKTIIDITVSKSENQYEFSIKDNGPGIEKQYHSKIFEMFNQLDTKKDGSTGIGLSIVKRIVLENQGDISVDSENGLGTTITFTWKI